MRVFVGDRAASDPSDKSGDQHKRFDWTANIVSPIIGSVAANLVLQPFDLVKMKMQSISTQRPSLFSTVGMIYREGGIRGFYIGTAINFLGGGLISSFRWTLYKYLYKQGKTSELWGDMLTRITLTSVIFGLTIPLFVTPVDHARIRVNLTKGEKYSGQFDAFCKIYKSHGLRGLYKANSVTILRDTIFYLVFFSSFETVQKFFDKRQYHSLGLNVASVSSAVFAWVACYPVDTIKTVLQKDSLSNPQWNSFTYLAHLKQQNHLNTLYNGLFSVLLRSAPVNMIFFSVWDTSLRFFLKLRESQNCSD